MHRFLLIYPIPKSNVLSFEFRMRGPLKESTSCFLIRLSPLVLVPIGLFHRTQCPLLYDFMGLNVLYFYLSQDPNSSLLSFTGLKVLAFILHRTQSPLSLCFHRTQSPLSFIFQRLQYLLSFTLYKTSTSSIFYRTQCPCLCAS